MLDTARQYETPEGIDLEMRIAGPVVRACAWAIDLVIRFGLYGVISILFAFLGGIGVAFILIGIFLVEWFYPVIFEVRTGATPGKKAMGLLVVHDNGTPVSLSSSLIRNLLRTADFFPFLYGFGLLAMLFNHEFKRLGDMAAGTLVVYDDRQVERMALPATEALRPPAGLTGDEQHTLLAFAERSTLLSDDRKAELAEILSDLTESQGQAGVEKLHAYANWLASGRGK
ncbi:MAG: RDD family protein [Candidatus Sedimenticola sp. (ex Thyasira tokunagai)]